MSDQINWFHHEDTLDTTAFRGYYRNVFLATLLGLLIFQFKYSARLKSKLKGKIYSHIVLRNCSPITEGDRSCSLPEIAVIIIFLISISIVFLSVWQTFMAGQPGMSTIKVNWRCNIFQPMIFCFVCAKQKWKFIRDHCKVSFPPPLTALLLALTCVLLQLTSLAIHGEF